MRPTRSHWDRRSLELQQIGEKSTSRDCCVCIANESRCRKTGRSPYTAAAASCGDMQPRRRAGGQGSGPGETRAAGYPACAAWIGPARRRPSASTRRLLLALILGATGTGHVAAIQLWLTPRLAPEPRTAIRVLGECEWSASRLREGGDTKTTSPQRPETTTRLLASALHFERDEHRLHSGHRWILRGVVDEAHEAPGRRLLIRGHADRTGPEGWNETLSRMRARSVAVFLRQHGIERRRLIVEACSDSIPAGPAVDEAMNRRVEIYWR